MLKFVYTSFLNQLDYPFEWIAKIERKNAAVNA